MADDYELLERWRRGDNAAAERLFERHFDAIFRFFSAKAGGGAGVEDLVQETFLAALQARDRVREASFRAYLFGVARHVLFAHYRQVRRRRAVDPIDTADEDIGALSLATLAPTASGVLIRRAEERLLLEALRRLPLDHQIVIELVHWENLRGPEVAAILGVSLAAMRSRLHRAKRELQRQLEGLASSPELLESTVSDLDAWAQKLRSAPAPKEPSPHPGQGSPEDP
ncbi:RNA polymerase ECF-type sigma factor [Plesiocystis pacifica SIR-1]|uniref:RNA polymerase sigma factor n=1 Tax=Plesiocystis pacifica SIR-1 TaxID=391625 RepID=A6G2A0_9BACT|nr:RNA polymerase sigma factor [Plesiocystis pacifica]EDM80069.1 RNA polymerase ECF-type sigma factor [Plesiocystis pacifica SIR-1]